MDISIESMDNGWLVVNRTIKTKKVFINREEMIAHINEEIPPMGHEQEFIDALDDDSENTTKDGEPYYKYYNAKPKWKKTKKGKL